MNDKTIVYSTYYNPMEANIIRAKLEDMSFACFLADENVAIINPLYNQAIGGVKLIVFERDVDEINQLLAEDSNEILAEEAKNFLDTASEIFVCEKCGSNNVSYGMATKNKFNWWVILTSVIVGIFYPGKGNKCYYCYDCGHEVK